MNSIRYNLNRFWHKSLRRPFRLAKPLDSGNGQPVILLHGIGRTGDTWQHLVEQLATSLCRMIAFDLLGFGSSPKPDWIDYDIDDHADAVIHSITKSKVRQPVIIVGHSMGCLVALRIASRRPDLVRHLVLYEMPLYEGLPEKRRYRLRLNLYSRFYQWVIRYQPNFDAADKTRIERLARRIAGFEVNPATWQPFVKSLEHSIMRQTAADDIKRIKVPMDVIYGTYDMFVIRSKTKHVFGEDNDKVMAHNIRARHVISTKASRFIASRIKAALRDDFEVASAE